MKRLSIQAAKSSPKSLVAFLLSLVLLLVSVIGITKVGINSLASGYTEATGTISLASIINPDTDEEMYTVRSTFYDYYSDSQIGSDSTPKSIDDGVYGTDYRSTENSFGKFNNILLKTKNYANACAAKYPLYLGLFFSSQSSNDNSNFYFNGNADANASTNFWLAANSSQQGGGNEGAVTDINTATQGLVDSRLSSSGNITQSNNGKTDNLPYFDKNYLTTTKHENSSLSLADVREDVAFPFRTYDKNGVTYYTFDSRTDTVRFDNNGSLNYLGQNKSQVFDQKKENGTSTKPGFFPYNLPSDSDSTSLNYGFGLKLELEFNMTADGKINGEDMVFEFSGDDDVWVYIDGILALDIGGAHSRVEGNINFSDLVSTVSGVKNNTVAFAERNWWYMENRNYTSNDSGLANIVSANESIPGITSNKQTPLDSDLQTLLADTTKTHTLTMFYMERGKIESNMMINFNLPEPNQYNITNTLDYSQVNESFLEETKTVASNDEFMYNVIDKDLLLEDELTLKGGDSTSYISQFVDKDTLKTTECSLYDDSRILSDLYSTKWTLSDVSGNITSSSNRDSYTVSDGRVEEYDAFLFANVNSTLTTKLQADYYNRVNINTLSFSKKLADNVSSLVPESNTQEFKFYVEFSSVFGGDSDTQPYVGTYTLERGDGTSSILTTVDGYITLKDGDKALINGIPVGTEYNVSEVVLDKYYIKNISKADEAYSNDAMTASGTIALGANDDNSFIFTNGTTVTPTPEPTVEPIAEPTMKPTIIPTATSVVSTFEPTIIPTVEPTKEVIITDAPVPETIKAAVKDSPTTGDVSATLFWVICTLLSASAVVFTAMKTFSAKTIAVSVKSDNNN